MQYFVCEAVSGIPQKSALARRRQSVLASDEGRRRNAKAFTESTDLTNIEFPIARQNFGNHALAANLAQIGLLETVLLHQEFQCLNPADAR